MHSLSLAFVNKLLIIFLQQQSHSVSISFGIKLAVPIDHKPKTLYLLCFPSTSFYLLRTKNNLTFYTNRCGLGERDQNIDMTQRTGIFPDSDVSILCLIQQYSSCLIQQYSAFFDHTMLTSGKDELKIASFEVILP